MCHPAADLLWVDEDGITPTELDNVEHWRTMRDPETALKHLLDF